MPDVIKFARPKGFFEKFERRPGPIKTNMHYCPGCGHGILHKLVAEAIADLGIKDHTVLISPVGCAVFAYYYFDCYGVQTSHGRAPAAATALSRVNPDSVVISYQGDGDLGAIGFNHLIQAANRGENMTVLFVNNVIYGMTGGQMAPTTLIGQVTQTTPFGRTVEETGYPLKVAELVSQLEAPVYVERVALSTVPNILKARKALRKALTNTMNKKGFSLVEFLSGCPVNLKKSNPKDMNDYIDNSMAKYFPLGCYKDIAESRPAIKRATPTYDAAKVKETLFPMATGAEAAPGFKNQSELFSKENHIKISGFGGQGVLSLGHTIANMGKLRNFNVSWLPSYGPEMRGGTANCSVVLSYNHIGSPQSTESNTDLLICLNQPSAEKFIPTLREGAAVIFDTATVHIPAISGNHVIYGVPAADIAKKLGSQKVANSVVIGAMAAMLANEQKLNDADKADFDKAFEDAIRESFASKPAIVDMNIKAYYQGKEAAIKQ